MGSLEVDREDHGTKQQIVGMSILSFDDIFKFQRSPIDVAHLQDRLHV